MSAEKIYVQLLDGSTAWVPTKVDKLDLNRFKILEDGEYIDFPLKEWPLHLFEFWPGDIVETEPHKFSDGQIGQVASKLIEPGLWPERKFAEFKFKATMGQLNLNQVTADKFKDEINRIKTDNLKGKFFYPALLETVKKLDELNEKNKSLHTTKPINNTGFGFNLKVCVFLRRPQNLMDFALDKKK
ncbi:hypothetical protein [Leeuwenhoekiella sp. W20_SRS_FM14]|uniref:hypothetical protein n=1 Tax=Leeuwenhoekiella sp. W20_SRS_FM14 TaxID=3240270 RepID=UPI003F9597D5